MGFVIQMQRRAIEALAPHLTPFTLEHGQRFFLDGEEVFFRGISLGFGTCSDLHGVDYAVLSAYPHNAPPLPPAQTVVQGLVFLRSPRKREEIEAVAQQPDNQTVDVVEALFIVRKDGKLVFLQSTGFQQSYIVI